MGSDLTQAFAIYPMVEEGEATGSVAGVYADLLDRMPFVPSLFKSFAVCPPYLVLAHAQARSVLGDDGFEAEGRRLASTVATAAEPPADPEVTATLAAFVGPLGRMTLLAAGLLLALTGDLAAPAAPADPPPPRDVQPREQQPSQWDAPAVERYGEIRAALATPIVNTIWRTLAGRGQLDAAWAHLAPQVGPTRAAADGLQREALAAASRLAWPVAATPPALDRAGAAEAAPGIAAILDAYVKTLPRVLALVACCPDR